MLNAICRCCRSSSRAAPLPGVEPQSRTRAPHEAGLTGGGICAAQSDRAPLRLELNALLSKSCVDSRLQDHCTCAQKPRKTAISALETQKFFRAARSWGASTSSFIVAAPHVVARTARAPGAVGACSSKLLLATLRALQEQQRAAEPRRGSLRQRQRSWSDSEATARDERRE